MIVFGDKAKRAQEIDNWIRFPVDIATLFLIIGTFFYILLVKKQPVKKGDLRFVYFQLAILFVA